MMTHYDLLGVPRDADPETIKLAYRHALKLCHPDLRDGDERADRRIRQINAAYDILKDSERRAKYDAHLRQRRKNLRVLAVTCLLTAALVSPATFLLLTNIIRSNMGAVPQAELAAPIQPASNPGAHQDWASAAFAEMAAAEKASVAANATRGIAPVASSSGTPEAHNLIEPLGPRTWQRIGETRNPFDLLIFAEAFPGTPEASLAEDKLAQMIGCSDNIPELIAIGGKAKGPIADKVRDRLMTLIRANPPSPKPRPEREGETAVADAGTGATPAGGQSLAEGQAEAAPAPFISIFDQTLPTSASEPLPDRSMASIGKPALGAAPASPAGGVNFAEIVPVSAEDAGSYLRRAAAWIGRGDLDRALADYDEAIQLDRGNVAAYRGRGLLWRQRGDADRALADLDHAIRLSFSDPDIYRERGLIWYERGRYDRAIADFNQAIKLAPRFANAYLHRGEAFLHKGEFKTALADFEHALQLAPNLAEARRGRDLALSSARDEQAALPQAE
jgi:tetratricopeptide (TPR) repeat protein